jgi:ABC-2 type transport system permease protein
MKGDAVAQSIALDPPVRRYGFGQAAKSEMLKLSTLRSTLVTLAITVVGTLTVTALAVNGDLSHARSPGFDPTNQSMTGLLIGMLTLGVLGALAVTGEYGTGAIRSSLSATPRRPLFVLAKVSVVGALTLIAGELLTFSCFGVGQLVLSAGGAPTAALGQPGVLRAVLLTGAALPLFALLGLGLGLVVRNTAGAVAAYAGLTFLLPFVLQRLPGDPSRFTPVPIVANSVAAVVDQGPMHLAAPAGFALIALDVAVVLALGAVIMIRRDA